MRLMPLSPFIKGGFRGIVEEYFSQHIKNVWLKS
jgi:hypothetical protein